MPTNQSNGFSIIPPLHFFPKGSFPKGSGGDIDR
jgi:hypothetical protein